MFKSIRTLTYIVSLSFGCGMTCAATNVTLPSPMGHKLALPRILSLPAAQKIALDTAPELKRLKYQANALQQEAIAAGQLKDPRFQAGMINVPTDTFRLDQENMTQLKFGLEQAFPRGHSLRIKSQQKNTLAAAQLAKRKDLQAQIIRNVRTSWLDLYYWQQAQAIVKRDRQWFQRLVKITESMLAANRTTQHDVIQAQLELSKVDEQQIQIIKELEISRAQLARWIGVAAAKVPQPKQLPTLPKVPTIENLQAHLKMHPELQVDSQLVNASQEGVKLAKQQFMPGWNLGVNYSLRQGNELDGKSRSDFVGIQGSVELPFFTHNRQDRTLKASLQNLDAAQETQASDYRRLNSALQAYYSTWQQLRKRDWLYRAKLLPEAKEFANATLTAYQNNQADFPTLVQAYETHLITQLDYLKNATSRLKAQANLLYIAGQT